MVVRATITAAFNLVPFTDRLPYPIQSLMGNKPSQLSDFEISPEEVRPLVTPSQKIRTQILRKRAIGSPESPKLASLSGLHSPIDLGEDSEDTVKDSESINYRQARVERYLSEQHDEFTTLINKNLREVMQQQEEKQNDEVGWRRLLLELAMARSTEDATQKVNRLVTRALDTVYSYIPFVRSEHNTRRLLAEYENSALKMETAELLDQLDYELKITLLRQLMVDLGMRADAEDIVHFTKGSSVLEETLMADKVELLALLLVRLWFIGLRYFLPLTRLVYMKFKENEILLVNNKNFSRLLTVLVRFMESLEAKLRTMELVPSRPDTKELTESV